MLPSFILTLREGLEAALIIGITLSVLQKLGRQDQKSMIWIGVLSAIVVSFLTAISLNWIGAEFNGQGEQLFEGATMLLAAGVLTWMVFWMRSQSKRARANIEQGVSQAIQGKGKNGIFLLTFLAVVREGIELALFLLAARLNSKPIQEFLGVAIGLFSSALVGWLIFTTSRRLSLARFFQITNIFLALFAAGLVGLGVHEFNELGWIPPIFEHIWNINGEIPDISPVGQSLNVLFGYDSSPSLSQVIAYLGYFIVLGGILLFDHKTALANKISKN